MHLRPPARADLRGRGGWVLIQGQLPPQPFAGGVSRAVRVGFLYDRWQERDGTRPCAACQTIDRAAGGRSSTYGDPPALNSGLLHVHMLDEHYMHDHVHMPPIWGGGVSCRHPPSGALY